MIRDSIISASNHIAARRAEIDALNVFPVPDGDTGTNMAMTLSAAAREASIMPDSVDVSQACERIAGALLRGARGNSGVILSLIFRGFAKAMKGVAEADGKDIARALVSGREAAYKAVMKPTEGTMLTVIRLASAKAAQAARAGLDELKVCEAAYAAAKKALADTPNMLPILKSAGVVDAGGQGLVYVFEGFKSVLESGVIIGAAQAGTISARDSEVRESTVGPLIAAEDIKFAYCTEFLVNREQRQVFDESELRGYLESIGDCVVVVADETVIKAHIHTNEPGSAIQKALAYGQITSVKVENMREQHQNASWGVTPTGPMREPESQSAPAEMKKRYGMVAVASGRGLEEIFRELGADEVVTGGQTMNPSMEQLLKAVQETPAEHVFIFPNNKNIIMAAEQVIPLTDKGVSVLHTKTVPQGITAALNLDEELSPEENHMRMMKAAAKVSTGLVTFAARDSSIDGQRVKQGEILGMENGRITAVDTDMVAAAYKVSKHLYRKNATSMITVYCGDGVERRKGEELVSLLKAKYGAETEISLIDGGQPVYYFMISVE